MLITLICLYALASLLCGSILYAYAQEFESDPDLFDRVTMSFAALVGGAFWPLFLASWLLTFVFRLLGRLGRAILDRAR